MGNYENELNSQDDEGNVKSKNQIDIFRETIDKMDKELANIDFIKGFGESDIGLINNSYKDMFTEVVAKRLENFYKSLNQTDRDNIYRLIQTMFVKNYFLLMTSGLVFAGFGEEELLPKIYDYKVEGMINSKITRSNNNLPSNTNDDSFKPTVFPFAQSEMVDTFVNGIAPIHTLFLKDSLNELLNDYYIEMKDSLLNSDEDIDEIELDKIDAFTVELFNNFFSDFENHIGKIFSGPLVNMIALLPKQELAAMAEALVNLTVFKTKITKDVESVGGPIDVAVISKGDGFVWVKRKHYYNPELNQH